MSAPTDLDTTEAPIARKLRLGLLALGAAGILGTAIELATIEHWGSLLQMIPWVVLGVMTAAILAVALRPTRAVVRTAQMLGLAALGSGVFGIVQHIEENLTAGPLDATFGARWDSMSTMSQWWTAASGQVGPAPILAPAVLGQIGLCVLLACWAHPVVRQGAEAVASRRGGARDPGGRRADRVEPRPGVAVRG